MIRLLPIALLISFLLGVPVHAQPFVQLWNHGAVKPVTTSDPLPVTISGGGSNSIVFGVNGTTAQTLANPLAAQLTNGTQAIDATHGTYFNQLQGNAVLSATNGSFANLLQGNAVLSNTNPLFITKQTVTQGNITNLTASVPNANSAVTLVTGSHHITVKTDPSAAVLYVDLAGGTATTADFRIEPGAAQTWDDLPSISSFNIIGASATGTYSVTAW